MVPLRPSSVLSLLSFPAAAKSKTPALVFSALLAEEWERDGVSRLAQLRAACWSKELVGGSHLDLDYG